MKLSRLRRCVVAALTGASVVAAALAVCLDVPVAAGASDNTLTWGLAATPRSLFGPTGFNTDGMSVMSLVNESMLKYGPNSSLQPNLASSWKAVSPTKYVYTVRKGIKFSDGHVMTAGDVAYSLGLQKDPKVASQMSRYLGNVTSIHATGNKVTVHLSKPDSEWKYVAAHPSDYVYESQDVRAHLAEYGTPAHFPIGTGPYKVQEYVPNSHITLVRNQYYWGKKPAYDKIVFQIIPDLQTMLLAMRTGQIDGTFDMPSAQLADWKRAGARIGAFPSSFFHALTLDMSSPPLNNIHVRKAISYAIDRTGIIKAIFGGMAQPAVTLTPPNLLEGALSTGEVKKGYAAIPSYAFDLAKAKAELAQSPVPNGFKLTLNMPADSQPNLAEGQVISANLGKIGIDVQVNPMPRATKYQTILAHGPNLGMQWVNIAGDIPDPIELTWLWLASDQAVKGGNNSSNFRNAAADKLIAQAQSTTSAQVSARNAIKAQQIAAQQAAVVPLVWPYNLAATSAKLRFVGLGPFFYETNWLDQLKQVK